MENESEVLRRLGELIEIVMPGSIRQAPQGIAYNGGFAIAVPGGSQVLVGASHDDPWFLRITAGIVYDVEDIYSALAWVNSKNSNFAFGRFYVSMGRGLDQRGSIVFEDQIFSGLLNFGPNIVDDWLPQVLKLGTEIAVNEPQSCISSVGGRLFGDSDEERVILWAASLG